MIGSLRARHREDLFAAGRHYQAFFRGEATDEATVGGAEFAEVMGLLRAFVLAHAKK